MKRIALVQARMGSTRLPGKVLRHLAGRPMLEHVLERLSHARSIDQVVVATTDCAEDDILDQWCAQRGHEVFRGSESDVLDRFHQAALRYEADSIVRVTADCPLIDPDLLDRVCEAFAKRQPQVDYASCVLPPRSFPRGLDVEVFRRDALEKAWTECRHSDWREHVTPYLYGSGSFRLLGTYYPTDLSHHRWTVDTLEDFEYVRQIVSRLPRDVFGWQETLAVVRERPDWQRLNRHVRQKAVQQVAVRGTQWSVWLGPDRSDAA